MHIVYILERSGSSRIPVHVENSSSSATRSYLIDFERRKYFTAKCVVCNHLLDDLPPTRICSECDHKIRYGAPRQSDIVRSKATNRNRPTYEPDFAPLVSSTPKTTSSRIIRCPHCKHENLSNDEMNGLDFHCSICRNVIPI
jgi:hypothetical protein